MVRGHWFRQFVIAAHYFMIATCVQLIDKPDWRGFAPCSLKSVIFDHKVKSSNFYVEGVRILFRAYLAGYMTDFRSRQTTILPESITTSPH